MPSLAQFLQQPPQYRCEHTNTRVQVRAINDMLGLPQPLCRDPCCDMSISWLRT